MTETQSQELTRTDDKPASQLSSEPVSVFQSEQSFAMAQRMARALTSSGLVPAAYKGSENTGNALIAMDMANRMGLSPMTVMQNLHVIEGRPSWASSFIISALNSCGMFSPLRFKVTDLGEREATYDRWEGAKGNRQKVTHKAKIEDKEFVAYAVEKGTGEVLEGPPVSFSMAVAEGWYFKPGSKWQTMPDLMGRYRAAAFFGRLYAPHILNGMQTDEEVIDVDDYKVTSPAPLVATEPTTVDKPAGRPSGVHAAMSGSGKGKATKGKAKAEEKKPEPEPEPETQAADEQETGEDYVDADYSEPGVDETSTDDDGDNDVPFDAPDDDDEDHAPA